MNAQVPYLLRCLIPAGLRNLASLEIDRIWLGTNWDTLHKYEGSVWYEMSDGNFHEKNPTNPARTFKEDYIIFYDDYIHSIVKGVPNLTELYLHGIPLYPSVVVRLLNS